MNFIKKYLAVTARKLLKKKREHTANVARVREAYTAQVLKEYVDDTPKQEDEEMNLKSTKEEIKMTESKKDDNAIYEFLKSPKAEFEQPFEGMFNQLYGAINALNNKLKSMQLDIDKFKAPEVSADESDSDSDELDNKPEHCCQMS